MKRDFELIRKLLFYFDEKPDPSVAKDLHIEGYSENEVAYHCTLLYDAGFLRCEPITSSTSDRVIEVLPFDLTWAGHEFLDKIRSDTVWSRVSTQVKTRGLALSFDVVSELAKQAIKNLLFGPMP